MSRTQYVMTREQTTLFFEEGYVVLPDVLPVHDLHPLQNEIDGLVDGAARELHAAGKIEDQRENEGFTTRLTRLLEDHPECRADYLRAIEGRAGGGHAGRAMFDVITHPRLLDAMACLVGPEIIGSSVYRIRPKVPGLDRGVVPWHQDSGYFAPHCDGSIIVTCWIPLVDATAENGCLQVLPRTHTQGVVTHHTGGHAGYLVIKDEELPLPPERAVTVPVPFGGALLMTNLTPHCSTPNTTDTIRWSIDLRYQGTDVPTNAFEWPEDFDPGAEETRIACYAPEGDFLVRSSQHPERVHTYEQFRLRRQAYETASFPGPNRGWQPVNNSEK